LALAALEALDGDADLAAARREWVGRVSEAIDELRSPYREVLLARLRHGASAAEIAHLFHRSPGQVRVQLHRGLELLRAKLPARDALAATALILPKAATGGATSLEAVRELVLAKAAAGATAPAAASVVLPSTLLVMSKTKLFAAFTLLLAVIGYRLWTAEIVRPVQTLDVVASDEPFLLPSPDAALADLAQDAAREAALEPEAIADVRELRGRVVAGESEQPIADARVRLIRPAAARQGWSELKLLEAYPELVTQAADGSLFSQTGADWPTSQQISSGLLARPGDERSEVLEETLTDAGGEFGFAIATSRWSGLLLEVDAPGCGSRLRPLVPLEGGDSVPETASSTDPQRQPDIALFRSRVVTVQLVDMEGSPLRKTLELRLISNKAIDESATPSGQPWASEDVELEGAWRATTDENGRLEMDVSGSTPWVSLITPGWASAGTFPKDGGALLHFHVRETSRVVFLDDDTDLPLEQVFLKLTSRAGHMNLASGEFLTPSGVYGIDERDGYRRSKCPLELVAWTDDHATASLVLEDLDDRREHIIRLRRGAPGRLVGRVVDRSGPVAGAVVGISHATSKPPRRTPGQPNDVLTSLVQVLEHQGRSGMIIRPGDKLQGTLASAVSIALINSV
ncbi:MAG: sigma-70 family RNA polymerase sigma factor, partial [Planctomycetota bacterium]